MGTLGGSSVETPWVNRRKGRLAPAARVVLSLGLLGGLAACASGNFSRTADYNAPGPVEDPWGPYIHEASGKYRVPEKWIRAVMRQESGGREFLNGRPITSNAGAMGLMQVMPSTYRDLAGQYGLGSDPYDPHDNIMAGTAYIRQMYDQFGSPGFLAAYNAGPGRMSSYVARGGHLPDETVNYVASIAPRLGDDIPASGPLAGYAGDGGYSARSRGSVMLASAQPARNPNSSRSLAAEAAWQTGGGQDGGESSIQSAVAAVPQRSAAEEAAWQTSPAQYSAGNPPPDASDTAAAPAPQPSPAPSPATVYAAATPAYAPPQSAYAPSPAYVAPQPAYVPPQRQQGSVLTASALASPVPVGAASAYSRAYAQPAYTQQPSYASSSYASPGYASRSYAPAPQPEYRLASAAPAYRAPSSTQSRYAPPVRDPGVMPEPPMPESRMLARAEPPRSSTPGILGTLPISHAEAATLHAPRLELASAQPSSLGRGSWTIQVGAYASPSLAREMTDSARRLAAGSLQSAGTAIGPVATANGGTLYRARFTGLSSTAASAACGRLAAGRMNCVTVPPDERW